MVHFPSGPLPGARLAVSMPGQARESGSAGGSLAAAAVAVATFVVVSLALSLIFDLALGAVGLIASSLAHVIGYFLVAGVAMFASRRFTDLFFAAYRGRWAFLAFLGTDIILITLAAISKRMDVDYLVSLSQMTAMCVFAYLQFWKWRGVEREENHV